MENISKIIARERKRQGLSTYKLGDMAKCSERTIAYYEQEKRKPTLEIADRILKALGVSMNIGKE